MGKLETKTKKKKDPVKRIIGTRNMEEKKLRTTVNNLQVGKERFYSYRTRKGCYLKGKFKRKGFSKLKQES